MEDREGGENKRVGHRTHTVGKKKYLKEAKTLPPNIQYALELLYPNPDAS